MKAKMKPYAGKTKSVKSNKSNGTSKTSGPKSSFGKTTKTGEFTTCVGANIPDKKW